MAVREYVGMRVVPILGRIGEESVIWDGGAYEALTVVMTEGGDTYISRCMVPAGTAITNEHYWAKFADFNAQFALLQQTVETYNSRITANTEKNATQDTSIQANADAIAALDGDVDDIAENVTTIGGTVAAQGETIAAHTSAIEGNSNDIDALEQQMAGATDSGLKAAITGVEDSLGYDFTDTDTVYDMLMTRGVNNVIAATESDGTIFIAGVSGDDTNGGTSDNDAVKTLDRALELAQERNWANVYLRFRESALYTCSRTLFSNGTVHWSAGSSATNVVIRFSTMCSVYNSYWNIGTYDGNVFRFEFDGGWHVDHSNIYCQYAQFNVSNTYNFNASEVWWIGVTINTSTAMRPINCFVMLNGITFNYSGTGMVVYAENSHVQIISNPVYVNASAQSTASAFRFDQCLLTFLSEVTQTGQKFSGGVLLVRTLLFTSATAKTTFANLVADASAAMTGTNALWKATNTLTELQ